MNGFREMLLLAILSLDPLLYGFHSTNRELRLNRIRKGTSDATD